jgi:hypothetical protein
MSVTAQHPAAEKLLDLLLEDAPAVDLAFERVLRSVIHGPASTGAPILDMLGGPRCSPHAALVVGAAA